MKSSESIEKLAEALAQFQAAVKDPLKSSINPHYRSKYADLHEVLQAIRSVAHKFGLSIVQLPGYADGRVHLETMICHASGQWIASELSAKPPRDDVQGMGSMISYLRRYAASAMLGLAQADDDGESAMPADDVPEIDASKVFDQLLNAALTGGLNGLREASKLLSEAELAALTPADKDKLKSAAQSAKKE